MNTTSPVSLQARHADLLRGKLIEWSESIGRGGVVADTLDLWFVDSDVMRTYLLARPNGYVSEWSSLFSLEDPAQAPERTAVPDDACKALTDATALAVSYFLFGNFRLSLSLQVRRLLVTPEIERELDAMVIAVSYEKQRVMPQWMGELTTHYLALARAEDSEALPTTLERIFDMLHEGSPVGQIARATELQRRLLSRLDASLPLFPTGSGRPGFVVIPDNRAMKASVSQLAQQAFEVFQAELFKLHPGAQRYRSIKKRAFDFHAPERLMRQYIDNELDAAQRPAPGAEEGGIDKATRMTQARIAAKEVSDIYSLARLVALAEHLNSQQAQPGRTWRVNLISGSRNQRRLHEAWNSSNVRVGGLRIVHPLSMMSLDGFAHPTEGVQAGFALRSLNGAARSEGDSSDLFADLTRLLKVTAAGQAPARETSLRNLRRHLEALDSSEHGQYMRHVRDVISREYVSTFAQLNDVGPVSKGQLPKVSLPTLSLPLSQDHGISVAQRWIMALHDDGPADKERRRVGGDAPDPAAGALDLDQLLKADSTGYSALLCMCLGYLAQGRDKLPLARAVADTALAFATAEPATGQEARYPEGNEAHYLAAFVSRMQVDPAAERRHLARDWLQAHGRLMREAQQRLQAWCRHEGSRALALRSVSADDQTPSATVSDLVAFRYEAERLAAAAYSHLMDALAPTEVVLAEQDAHSSFRGSCELARRWDDWSRFTPDVAYRAECRFINAQITATLIQNWVCAQMQAPLPEDADADAGWLVQRVLRQRAADTASQSSLVSVLTQIVLSRTAELASGRNLPREAARFDFAQIDHLRLPFLLDVLRDPARPLSSWRVRIKDSAPGQDNSGAA